MHTNSYCCYFAPRKSLNSLVFDPCGNVPEKGDFLMRMQKNVENLLAIYLVALNIHDGLRGKARAPRFYSTS